MPTEFTTLKGFDSFKSIDILNEVQQTTIMFFDWGFLNKGAFTNVRLSSTDINSNNHSILRPVKHPGFTNGRVWETFHHNIVWESGVQTSTQPIAISGVYVNGTLRTPTSVGYEHYIDYKKGQVIFNSARSTSDVIKMEYSYKYLDFQRVTAFPETHTLQENAYDFDTYMGFGSGAWSSLLRYQTPLIGIEVSPRTDFSPVSLGTGAQWVNVDMLIHVFDTNDSNVLKLLNYIALQKEKTIYRIDMNLIAASGEFPLDYRGAKSSSPKSYEDFVMGNYRNSKMTFMDSTISGPTLLADKVYHGVVKFQVETISVV